MTLILFILISSRDVSSSVESFYLPKIENMHVCGYYCRGKIKMHLFHNSMRYHIPQYQSIIEIIVTLLFLNMDLFLETGDNNLMLYQLNPYFCNTYLLIILKELLLVRYWENLNLPLQLNQEVIYTTAYSSLLIKLPEKVRNKWFIIYISNPY